MGKKKFINKKQSATFQLLARDTNDPNYNEGPNGDRVFIRVDDNPYSLGEEFGDDDSASVDCPEFSGKTHLLDCSDSVFADAPEDDDDDEDEDGLLKKTQTQSQQPLERNGSSLPDHVRREILELGFPDDGYNYLHHLREIKNTGGGSAYYENSKAKLEPLPLDVKAYDASRVRVAGIGDVESSNSIYAVAARTYNVRVQKAADPEVSALLDDSDMSRFGSDVEDLDEDFVVQANVPDEVKDDGVVVDKKINLVEQSVGIRDARRNVSDGFGSQEGEILGVDNSGRHHSGAGDDLVDEKPRVHRQLDEKFKLLNLTEYGTDTESDYDGSVSEEEDVPLAVKLNDVLKGHGIDRFDLDGKYKVPADILRGNEASYDGELVESAAVLHRVAEYAEKYADESENHVEVDILEESSDESEVWDCETILSTYSNLDNHPGKIEAPVKPRKKKLLETIVEVPSAGNHVIALRGKEKIPVDYLPHNKKSTVDKVSKVPGLRSDQLKRKPHGGESKEEKKERKAAVKEDRREARKAKKELKGIYRSETQRSQRVAAGTGASTIHLM